MKFRILICDDNRIELKIIYTYIQAFVAKYRQKVEINTFFDAQDVIKFSEINPIDVAFLDINMGEEEYSGLKLAGHILQHSPKVVTVFVTGEMVSVPEVFSVRCFDYIQKPIDSEKFRISFIRAIRQASVVNNTQSTASLMITVDNLKKKIRQSNIHYIEKEHARSRIVLNNGETFYVYETIKSLSERLEQDFIQVNQSVILNMSIIADINKGVVLLKNGTKFVLGRTYVKTAKDAFQNYQVF